MARGFLCPTALYGMARRQYWRGSLRGEAVDPSEYDFRIAAFFETGAEKYAWLNNIISVGYGERLAKGPRYTIFEIL